MRTRAFQALFSAMTSATRSIKYNIENYNVFHAYHTFSSLLSYHDVHHMVYKYITDRKSMLPIQPKLLGINW
jgi:hypothetical protein